MYTGKKKKIIAESEINVIKPALVFGIKGKKRFTAPAILKHTVSRDKENIEIIITGNNFIGKRAQINGKKIIIPKKNPSGLKSFTQAEFKNEEIKITKTLIRNKKTELVINAKLPENYKGTKEELFVSTPAGQVYVEIEVPGI